jgi:hypothetical protein
MHRVEIKRKENGILQAQDPQFNIGLYLGKTNPFNDF